MYSMLRAARTTSSAGSWRSTLPDSLSTTDTIGRCSTSSIVNWRPFEAVVGSFASSSLISSAIQAKVLALIAVAGLIASFHSIIYAYGRNIYALSRAGYFPHWLSATHGARQTPHVALLVGAALGFVVAILIEYSEALFGAVPVGAVLLNMAVFGAVLSYVLQAAAFLSLRRHAPELLDARDSAGRTALHLAAGKGHGGAVPLRMAFSAERCRVGRASTTARTFSSLKVILDVVTQIS